MRYIIFDKEGVDEINPFGKFLTEEEAKELFKEVFNDGETFGHTQTDGSWEETFRRL